MASADAQIYADKIMEMFHRDPDRVFHASDFSRYGGGLGYVPKVNAATRLLKSQGAIEKHPEGGWVLTPEFKEWATGSVTINPAGPFPAMTAREKTMSAVESLADEEGFPFSRKSELRFKISDGYAHYIFGVDDKGKLVGPVEFSQSYSKELDKFANKLGESILSENPAGQIERLQIHDPATGEREVKGYSQAREWFYEDGSPIEVGGTQVLMIKGHRDNPWVSELDADTFADFLGKHDEYFRRWFTDADRKLIEEFTYGVQERAADARRSGNKHYGSTGEEVGTPKIRKVLAALRRGKKEGDRRIRSYGYIPRDKEVLQEVDDLIGELSYMVKKNPTPGGNPGWSTVKEGDYLTPEEIADRIGRDRLRDILGDRDHGSGYASGRLSGAWDANQRDDYELYSSLKWHIVNNLDELKDSVREENPYGSFAHGGRLTSAERHQLPFSDFAVPQYEGLPIDTPARTRAAMSRFNQYGFKSKAQAIEAYKRILSRAKRFDIDASNFKDEYEGFTMTTEKP